jgi:hypothetical protein
MPPYLGVRVVGVAVGADVVVAGVIEVDLAQLPKIIPATSIVSSMIRNDFFIDTS